MAFCTYCGRSLREGEACSCRVVNQPSVTPIESAETADQSAEATIQESFTAAQVSVETAQVSVVSQPDQPNVFVEFFKLLWAIAVGVLKTPVTSINTFIEKADAKVACALIGLYAIVAALVRWFGLLQTNNEIYLKYTAGYIFKQVCCSALYIIAAAAVVALVIMITINIISETKATYVQGLAIASLTAILLIPTTILAYIFGLFGVVFFSLLANWVTAFVSAAGAIYVFFGVRALCKDENKIPLVAGLCAVGSAIAIYLINIMF